MSHSLTPSLLGRLKVELEKIKITCSDVGLCGSISVSITLSFCAAILSGCTVVFKTPLPRSLKTDRDERLLDKWAKKDEQGNPFFIQFDSGANGETNISLFGEKPNLGFQNPVFRMVTTKFENRDYMILRFSKDSNREGYQIARYDIKGDKLTIWVLDVDQVKEASKTGALRGVLTGSTSQGLVLSSSAMTVLKTAKDKDLFVSLGEFERAPNKK